MKCSSLMLSCVLCGLASANADQAPPAAPAQPAAEVKADVTGGSIGKSLCDEIKNMKDKALKLRDPIEKVLGIDPPEKKLADTLVALEKNPEKLDLVVEYCSSLERIITDLRTGILATLDQNLTRQQKIVVDGLNQLAAIVDESARKAQAKAQQLGDPEARKRYETLASDYRKIAGAYRIVARRYAELPLAEQVKKVQQQLEYLEDVREFVVHVREVAIPLVGSQNALDQLRDYAVAIEQVQKSVSRFAAILSEGVVKFDPQKQAFDIVRQQSTAPVAERGRAIVGEPGRQSERPADDRQPAPPEAASE